MNRPDKTIDWSLVFEKQGVHFFCLFVLLLAVYWLSGIDGVLAGSLFGISTCIWFFLLIADTVDHQIFVWLAWRLELHGLKLTSWFGSTERAFSFYRVVFAILFGARFVLIALLAVSNQGTLPIDPWLGYAIAAILAIPAIYLFYSVRTYFGFDRAFGIDHFDPAARNWPMVRKGIFKFTSNGMYVFGIGALWIPVFALQSSAALIAAAFSHIYIWVHYFTVEKPDMERIYRSPSDE
jgi:hypothetical protein